MTPRNETHGVAHRRQLPPHADYAWSTPIGVMTARVTPAGLAELVFPPTDVVENPAGRTAVKRLNEEHAPLDAQTLDAIKQHAQATEAWLRAYFKPTAGQAQLPQLDWTGRTAFDRRVGEALLRRPFGSAMTYGELAGAVGNPRGARAVGGAMRRNRFVLIVPCHRVLASGGAATPSLGGFSGGLLLKQYLLAHEHIHATAPRQSLRS